METVQLTITDAAYASALREQLERSGGVCVECVDAPDIRQRSVIVVDPAGLDRIPLPVRNPERLVLITRNDPEHLSRAWNAGIRSVVFNEDPLSTAVLAIMAAGLRLPEAAPGSADSEDTASGAAAPAGAATLRPGGPRKGRG